MSIFMYCNVLWMYVTIINIEWKKIKYFIKIRSYINDRENNKKKTNI